MKKTLLAAKMEEMSVCALACEYACALVGEYACVLVGECACALVVVLVVASVDR
jgi:hypothetical protein